MQVAVVSMQVNLFFIVDDVPMMCTDKDASVTTTTSDELDTTPTMEDTFVGNNKGILLTL